MLTSLQNPLIKKFRKLHQSKERKRQRMFLLEGTHILMEACATGVAMNSVCFTQAWQDTHTHLMADISSLADRIEVVSEAVLAAIATTVNPDGVVAIADSAWYDRLHNSSQRLEQFAWQLTHPFLGIAVDNLQDPGNLGTIIRTCAAVEIDQLWLSTNGVDPTHPKVLRASAGQWFRVPMAVSSNLVDALATSQSVQSTSSLQVIATCPDTDISYWDIDYSIPSLILVGNEGGGLSITLMEKATHKVKIPQALHVESLNVAIATALVLYEARRQRRYHSSLLKSLNKSSETHK
ncbi:MAG: RNA methyltransferase [Cyanobacteria bacterium P01_F01_bin.150]